MQEEGLTVKQYENSTQDKSSVTSLRMTQHKVTCTYSSKQKEDALHKTFSRCQLTLHRVALNRDILSNSIR